jgi:hypothetical protein
MNAPINTGVGVSSMRDYYDEESRLIVRGLDDPNSHCEDTPAWPDDQLDRAELAIGGVVVWRADSTLTALAGRRSTMPPGSRRRFGFP